MLVERALANFAEVSLRKLVVALESGLLVGRQALALLAIRGGALGYEFFEDQAELLVVVKAAALCYFADGK